MFFKAAIMALILMNLEMTLTDKTPITLDNVPQSPAISLQESRVSVGDMPAAGLAAVGLPVAELPVAELPADSKEREGIKIHATKLLSEKQRLVRDERLKVMEMVSGRVETIYRQALKSYIKKEFIAAYGEFKNVAEVFPGYKNTEENMEEIYKKMTLLSKHDVSPDIEMIPYAIGFISYYSGEYVNAVNEWEKFLAIMPGNAEAKRYLKSTQAYLHDLIEKERLRKLEGIVEDTYKKALYERNNRRYVSAVDKWGKIIQIADREKARQLIEWSLKSQVEIDKTISEMKGMIKSRRTGAGAGKGAGSGQGDGSGQGADTGVSGLAAETAERYYERGLVMYSTGNLTEAIRHLELSLRFNPGNTRARRAIEKIKEEIPSD